MSQVVLVLFLVTGVVMLSGVFVVGRVVEIVSDSEYPQLRIATGESAEGRSRVEWVNFRAFDSVTGAAQRPDVQVGDEVRVRVFPRAAVSRAGKAFVSWRLLSCEVLGSASV